MWMGVGGVWRTGAGGGRLAQTRKRETETETEKKIDDGN